MDLWKKFLCQKIEVLCVCFCPKKLKTLTNTLKKLNKNKSCHPLTLPSLTCKGNNSYWFVQVTIHFLSYQLKDVSSSFKNNLMVDILFVWVCRKCKLFIFEHRGRFNSSIREIFHIVWLNNWRVRYLNSCFKLYEWKYLVGETLVLCFAEWTTPWKRAYFQKALRSLPRELWTRTPSFKNKFIMYKKVHITL